MLVKFTKEHVVRISGTDSKVYPAGWTGDVDDKIAAVAIRAEKAEAVVTAAPDPKPSDGAPDPKPSDGAPAADPDKAAPAKAKK